MNYGSFRLHVGTSTGQILALRDQKGQGLQVLPSARRMPKPASWGRSKGWRSIWDTELSVGICRCYSVTKSCPLWPSEPVLCIRWPKYCSFSFRMGPSNEYSGLISFRMDWLDLRAVQGTLKSLLQHHSSKVLGWHSSVGQWDAQPFSVDTAGSPWEPVRWTWLLGEQTGRDAAGSEKAASPRSALKWCLVLAAAPGSPALQADSLPSEPPRKPFLPKRKSKYFLSRLIYRICLPVIQNEQVILLTNQLLCVLRAWG